MNGIYIPARKIRKIMDEFEVGEYDKFREQLRRNADEWLREEARNYGEMINE